MRKFIMLGLMLLVVGAGIYAYLLFVRSIVKKDTYSDAEYGFIIKDTDGWYSVPPDGEVYLLMATSEDEEAAFVSTFGVSPVAKVAMSEKEDNLTEFEDLCRRGVMEVEKENISSERIVLNGLDGAICSYEAVPFEVDEVYVMDQYLLINEDGKEHDYMIFVSYPKRGTVEKGKVDRIVNSFYAL